MTLRPTLFAFGFAAAAALATAVSAQTTNAGTTLFKNVGGFDHIQSDDVQYNLNNGDFTLRDRFTAVREGTEITADRASGNSKSRLLHAEGHVVVHQNQPLKQSGRAADLTQKPSTLTCDKLDVDGNRTTACSICGRERRVACLILLCGRGRS